jgi:DNA invertase Pin-like site-specific DNA recombinase
MVYCRIYRAAKESDAMDLGYARVSTREQDLTGQIAELQASWPDRLSIIQRLPMRSSQRQAADAAIPV